MSSSWSLRLLKIGSVLAVSISVFIGVIISGYPGRVGFYRWLSFQWSTDKLKGLAPSFLEDEDLRYTYKNLYKESDLIGKNAIVTGANSGLGYWTSYHLVMLGAHVVMACRSPIKCKAAAMKIRNVLASDIHFPYPGGTVKTMILDTSNLKTVESFATLYSSENPGQLDILVLNAGFGAKLDSDELSKDGIELVFATNHVGHHYLYNLLLPKILMGAEKSKSGSRVVLTSSAAHYDSPSWGVGLSLSEIFNAGDNYYYSQSKLAQILFAQEATRRLDLMETKASSNVFVNSCHPGAVNTNIWTDIKLFITSSYSLGSYLAELVESLQKQFMFTPEEGALTQLFLAASSKVKDNGIKGKYYHPQAVEVNPHPKFSKNLTLQMALWDFTESLLVTK